MLGFDPRQSFGYGCPAHTSPRGDEEEETAAPAPARRNSEGHAGVRRGTGRIALPLRAAGVRVDGIEQSQDRSTGCARP